MPLRDGDDAPLNLEAPSSPDHERAPSLVVGVGASAGGLEALERLLRALPGDTGMAFVVAQHLAPDFKSMMHEILRRFTSMTTVPVEGTVVMRPDTIYLLTPRQEMVIDGLRLISTDRPADRVHSHPIDTLLRSLARTWGERGVAIVLSGTGSDGSAGAAEVRDVGGLVIAQSPESCRFDGMPRSVIDAGCVDAVLTPEDMAATLVAYAEGGRSAGIPLAPARDQVGEGAPRIFERLRAAYGVDFDDYKPGTVTRRIERRAALHPEHLDVVEYARRVEQDDDELDLLYKDLLIGVTRFFRDPEAFAVLADRVIPDLVARAGPEEEVRIWVAACHTGEEAYSLAILFFEAFAAIGAAPRVKVLATDIRPEALQVAGEGVYPESSFVDMPVELRDRYFVPQPDGAWRVTASLRRALLFSNHNLLKAAPFTRIDLLSCRNMLIYLEGTAQRRAIAAFHASLRADSCLFLGPSEGLGELGAEFGVVDRHWKIFTKLHESRLPQDHRRPPSHGSRVAVPPAPGLNGARLGRAYDLLLSAFVPSGVLVNDRHEAVHVFGDANRYLSPPSGRVSADVLPMVRGHLRAAMMAGLRHAQQRSTPVEYRDVTHEVDGERVLLNMTIRPLIDPAQSNRYYMVTLEEVRPIDAPPVAGGEPPEADELAHVSALERELQQARESLQSTIEALETGNEELQATNEELLASNEEIQSTNEELHSVNMELYSVNAEHEVKIQELNAVTSDLNNLIASTRIATVFVGTDLSVRLFTPEATRVFPLQPQDIGRDLRHFRPVEPDDRLIDDIQRVLTTHAAIEHNVAWSDGRTMLRRITAYQDNNHTTAGAVLTYIDISETARLAVQLQRSRARLAAMVESNPNGMLVADDSGDILMVNPSLERMFGYGVDDLLGAPVELLLPEGSRVRHVALRGGYERQPTARPMGAGRELSGRRRDGTLFPIEVSLSAFQDGGRTLMQAMVVDISERRAAEVAIAASQATNARLASIVASSDDAIVGADPDGQITT
ncbi:MAG TPA: chemotaxis protein CheB, partial [Myxococcota bacterium]|nr:chemotaxis protein CheB [Myxococcota bacterium]